ncbi:hypothetical protein [Azospirillum sp. SYSU D00513]|uniref:hypothetical protein n=1 Tax=Azospirillum sp. SYSU D00513 TaxID=2812561 RepID=UPI001A976A5C|nr:hypothetical protein [Azospirillum sp. SYSU D00513]
MRSGNRRSLLRAFGGLLAAGAAASAARPAFAIQERDSSDYRAMIENACGANQEHARLAAELRDKLGLGPDDPNLRTILAAATCPNCGCALLTALPDGGSGRF